MSAPRSVRRRKIENGSKGWRWRRSITTNTISRARGPGQTRQRGRRSPADVDGVNDGVDEQRQPAVTVTAPGRSNVVVPSPARLSASVRGASSAAMSPIGTLTNSTQRQLSPLVRIPPSSTRPRRGTGDRAPDPESAGCARRPH